MSELQDTFAKIMANYDSVQRMTRDAETTLANTKAEQKKAEEALNKSKQEHGKLLAELDAKKIAADSAAAEAALRIQVNRDQTAELLKIREDNERREKAVVVREAAITEVQKKLMSKSADLQAREDEVAKREADIAARRAKLQEALT
jgi:hypothetical protein